MSTPTLGMENAGGVILDFDGTLVDSVYQQVVAWRRALDDCGIQLSVWKIHRRIGMSGDLLINALVREVNCEIDADARRRPARALLARLRRGALERAAAARAHAS